MRRAALALTLLALAGCHSAPPSLLVLQTDFGLKDGAVATMRGVALAVEPGLQIHDLTHEIPPFDIWQAAYRLQQTSPYWPEATVFVSVVDPGVGTDRLPIVARDRDGHLFVTPDNGTLTLLLDADAVTSVRVIETARHQRPGSSESHTFHGRDVFAIVGAKLAAGVIDFADVGPLLATNKLTRIGHPLALAQPKIPAGSCPALSPCSTCSMATSGPTCRVRCSNNMACTLARDSSSAFTMASGRCSAASCPSCARSAT